MDRNDQIFFSVLGGTLALAVLCAVIAFYATSATAAAWFQSILTVVAIAAAIAVPLWGETQRREARHHIAEVTVSSSLRSWMRVAAQEVSENNLARSSGGHDGTTTIDFPALAISVEQVAAMRSHYSRQILSLLERRERRQNDIYATRYYRDETDALMEYYEEIAHLFWSVRRIYQEIAVARGLDQYTNRAAEVAAIKRGVEYAKEFRRLEQQEI